MIDTTALEQINYILVTAQDIPYGYEYTLIETDTEDTNVALGIYEYTTTIT